MHAEAAMHTQHSFSPSRVLLPFSGVFFIVTIYVTVRIFMQAPFIITLVAFPFILFTLWWFAALYVFTYRYSVSADEKELMITRPINLFEYETIHIRWGEIRDVEFKIDPEFNPRFFTGRNAKLTFRLEDKKILSIDQVTMIDHYPDFFALIQGHRPFVYQIPEEQMWDFRARQLIVGGLIVLVLLMLSLFIF